MRASDIKPSKQIFGLFIGRSGSGKDCAAFSFPTPMKVFDVDLRSDGGALGTTWLSKEHKDKIDITKIYPNQGFKKIDDEMVSILLQFQSGQRPYETIYFGSCTSLQDLFLTEAGRLIKGMYVGGKTEKDKLTGEAKQAGGVRVSGPPDYKYLYGAFRDVMDYLRLYPINIIMSAHTMPRYDKPKKEIEKDGQVFEVEDTYADSVPVGEKLTLSDKLSENVQILFNEVYRFEKRMSGDNPKYYVKFRSDVAKTVHQSLPNGEIEITGKNFYETWLSYVDKQVKATA